MHRITGVTIILAQAIDGGDGICCIFAPMGVSPNNTKQVLLSTARRLFAQRGIRNVTVREIAMEAGQKNRGAVAYHFTTKNELISQILINGAAAVEKRRLKYLNNIETSGGPSTVREVVSAVIVPATDYSDDEDGHYFAQFLRRVTVHDPEFVDRIIAGRYNFAYQRCLAHLRNMLPHLDRKTQSRRFVFLGDYLSVLLARREAAQAAEVRNVSRWRSREAVEEMITTSAAILEAAPWVDEKFL